MKLMTAAVMATSLIAGAAQAQTFCVYDPAGAQGPNVAFAKDYILAAKSWGVSLVVPEQSHSQANAQPGFGLRPSIAAVSRPFRLSQST